MANKKTSGVKTLFNDSKGNPIHMHDYVKDSAGNCYFINSHYQAVPYGDNQDAAALSLDGLMKQGPVTIMSPEEVLAVNYGSGRPKDAKASTGIVQAEKKADKESAASPVDMDIVLSSISEVALVDELRRRGFFVTAVKPALIQL